MSPAHAYLDNENLDLAQDMLRQMMRVRRIEEAIQHQYEKQHMRCPVHLSVGQEATAVGVCQALQREDVITCSHRAHAPYLAKGGDLNRMIAELHGKVTGCAKGRGGSMHLFDLSVGVLASIAIVSSSIPLAVGAALGFRQQGKSQVAIAFLGDAAVEEGVFHESAMFAATHQLPVVFVCENNQYSVYTPLHQRQPDRPLVGLASAYGMPGVEADGNDVMAVYAAAKSAVERARQGLGPTLLVLPTYRWLEHCGPYEDDHLGYRPPEDVVAWRGRCPIAMLQAKLGGSIGHEFISNQLRSIDAEILAAFDAAEQASWPDLMTVQDHVYA
jgi:TPP-dependent pyruvate/acetoin dehydrogenase alpha subunit